MSKQQDDIIGCGIIGLFVGVFLLGLIAFGNVTQSSGVRYGTIQKCSQNGIVWATNEITFKPDNEGGTYVWEASCPDARAWASIQEAAAKGRRVKLSYRKTLGALPWRQDTHFLIEDCSEATK